MTTLHLGVIDIPYGDEGTTTGDVAQILEDHYAVMDGFVFLHRDDIAEAMAESLSDALETMMQGAPPATNPFAAAESKIIHGFRTYLDREEIVNVGGSYNFGNVPTKAALEGRSSRFKLGKQAAKVVRGRKGRKKTVGKRRPSFIDTGLYQATSIAWVDNNA